MVGKSGREETSPRPTATPPLKGVGSLGEVYGRCLSNTSRASKPDKQRAHGQLTGGGRSFCIIPQKYRRSAIYKPRRCLFRGLEKALSNHEEGTFLRFWTQLNHFWTQQKKSKCFGGFRYFVYLCPRNKNKRL